MERSLERARDGETKTGSRKARESGRERKEASERAEERKRAVSTCSNSFGVSLEEARQKEGDREQNKSNQGIFRRDVWPKSISTPSLPYSAQQTHHPCPGRVHVHTHIHKPTHTHIHTEHGPHSIFCHVKETKYCRRLLPKEKKK